MTENPDNTHSAADLGAAEWAEWLAAEQDAAEQDAAIAATNAAIAPRIARERAARYQAALADNQRQVSAAAARRQA